MGEEREMHFFVCGVGADGRSLTRIWRSLPMRERLAWPDYVRAVLVHGDGRMKYIPVGGVYEWAGREQFAYSLDIGMRPPPLPSPGVPGAGEKMFGDVWCIGSFHASICYGSGWVCGESVGSGAAWARG